MKQYALIGLAFSLFAGAANATVTTYSWHQTWSSLPELVFVGHYTVADGVTIVADSTQTKPDFTGLTNFFVSGGGMAPVTSKDLTPRCESSIDCMFDFPQWTLSLTGNMPDLYFIDAWAANQYIVLPFSIAANTDGPSTLCNSTGACWAAGYWEVDTVPAPAALPVFAAGLLCLFGAVRVRRGRTRS